MKILAYVVAAATIFEAVGDAIMRVALRSPYALPGRIALFCAGIGVAYFVRPFQTLAPVEFATVTGIYLASLFIAFQIVNLHLLPSPPLGWRSGWVEGFIVAGAAIIYFWK